MQRIVSYPFDDAMARRWCSADSSIGQENTMIETTVFAPSTIPHHKPVGRDVTTDPYRDAERRSSRQLSHDTGVNTDPTAWLRCMLDEIDHGMLLVGADAQIVYCNHAARLALDGQLALQMLGSSLRARQPQDVAPLYEALAGAQRGLRKLLTLGAGAQRLSVSLMPMPGLPVPGRAGSGALTLLVLSKQHFCQSLSVQAFARGANLTPAETRVLEMLCDGALPSEIAKHVGVAVCTVRSQIGSIRTKTGTGSIGDLVRQVSLLPPMLSALRMGAGTGMGMRMGVGVGVAKAHHA
jgi:DNA-binding CsgD family transcriptional regulator